MCLLAFGKRNDGKPRKTKDHAARFECGDRRRDVMFMPYITIANENNAVKILAIGVGDIGGRAVDRMKEEPLDGVEAIGADTNWKEHADQLAAKIMEADVAIVVCGIGNEADAASAIAKMAMEQGILTIGVAARSSSEGIGIDRFQASVDTLAVIPGGNLPDAAEGAMVQVVRAIADSFTLKGTISLDFNDLSMIMKDKGRAFVGIGSAKGDDHAREAVKLALANPLTETAAAGAGNVMIYFTGNCYLDQVSDAMKYVNDVIEEDANLIFGVKFDESVTDETSVTVIATGFFEDIWIKKESFDCFSNALNCGIMST